MINRYKVVCVNVLTNNITHVKFHDERYQALADVEISVDLNNHCVGFVYDCKTGKVVEGSVTS